jgi:hypothetical protein
MMYEDYNKNKHGCGAKRPTRSLETKGGIIKYDVVKFCECYGFVVALNEFGSSKKDILQKALELYKKQTFEACGIHLHQLLAQGKRSAQVGKHV